VTTTTFLKLLNAHVGETVTRHGGTFAVTVPTVKDPVVFTEDELDALPRGEAKDLIKYRIVDAMLDYDTLAPKREPFEGEPKILSFTPSSSPTPPRPTSA
jgi:hypothetical protein